MNRLNCNFYSYYTSIFLSFKYNIKYDELLKNREKLFCLLVVAWAEIEAVRKRLTDKE